MAKVSTRIELATLCLDVLFIREEQAASVIGGRYIEGQLNHVKLDVLRSKQPLIILISTVLSLRLLCRCVLAYPLQARKTLKGAYAKINKVLGDKCRYQRKVNL